MPKPGPGLFASISANSFGAIVILVVWVGAGVGSVEGDGVGECVGGAVVGDGVGGGDGGGDGEGVVVQSHE